MLFTDIAQAMGTSGGNAGAQGSGGALGAFIPLILMFAIFYFLLIRPQQKKAKQHKEMIGNLKIGERVVTNGGLFGTIVRFNDPKVVLEIADKVQVELLRSTIADRADAFGKPVAKKKGK